MSRKVFLSYSRADEAFVLSLANELSRRSIETWVDQNAIVPGDRWGNSIPEAIEQCSAFIVVLSPDAVDSVQVKREIQCADEAHKTIIPIVYRPCKLPFEIKGVHFLDWRSGKPDDTAALDRLVSALARVEPQASDPKSLNEIKASILKLLRSQLQLLDGLISAPGLLRSRSGRSATTVGGETAEDWKKILENEQKKVAAFELVLTVVGTMKAGKSTAINAIVGTEILPRDHLPMTSLPTRVRHQSGRAVPTLTIPKLAPIAALCSALRTRLGELRRDGQLQTMVLYDEPKCRIAIDTLLAPQGRTGAVSKTYEGFAAIHAFLTQLNSWVRLARDPKIHVGLPLDRFVEIDDIPVIDVEFSHLRSMSLTGQGTFTLLDTPGLGEYGQTVVLRRLFAQQLRRSSTVLMVVDCVALKGQEEKRIREELAALAAQVGDRLFVLVNKFDAIQDGPDADAEALSQYVSERLMSELHMSRSRVHVGSGLDAFLSHRALHELETTGALRDSPESPWLQEFSKKALGVGWRQRSFRPEEARQAAEQLWDSSGFAPLIENVIKSMASASSVLSLQAALDRTQDFAKRISTSLGLRKRGRIGDKATVQKDIAQMQSQIDVIEAAIVKVHEDIDQAAAHIKQSVDDIHQRKKESLISEIDTIFHTRAKVVRSKSQGRRHVDAQMTLLQTSYEKTVASMEDDVRREYEKIRASCSRRIQELARKLTAMAVRNVGDLDLKISQEATLIEVARGRLKSPTVRMTSRTTETERRVPKTSGPFGGQLARFGGKIFNVSTWGFETKTSDVTTYTLNESVIKREVLESTDQRLNELHEQVRQQVKEAFLSYRRILVKTTGQLKDYQRDLKAGLESKAMEGDELDALVGVVDDSLLQCGEHLKQVALVHEMIERSDPASGGSSVDGYGGCSRAHNSRK